MKLQIKVDDDGNIIESKFKTFGCGSAIASSSVATEWVKGKTMDEILSITNQDIASHLKLPPVKLHCSMLAEDAIKAAVSDLKAKREQPKPTGKFDRRELLGVHQKPQEGKVQVGILVPAGRLSHVECRCIAHISNKYSYREIRLAVEQNGILKAMMVLVVFEKFIGRKFLWNSIYLEQ